MVGTSTSRSSYLTCPLIAMSETLAPSTPGSALSPPSTADTHDAHVIPPTARVTSLLYTALESSASGDAAGSSGWLKPSPPPTDSELSSPTSAASYPAAPIAASSASTGAAPRTESSFVSRLWWTTPSTPPTIRTARSTFARQPLQTIPSARSRTTRGACSSEAAGAGAGRATKLPAAAMAGRSRSAVTAPLTVTIFEIRLTAT
mmetsp:Transcript_12395/g.39955  ORF Transcript_12395/g.39955 Transcript_12395/m.39955 type:complete len:204 (+) Transcript_12395:787-1398(+)